MSDPLTSGSSATPSSPTSAFLRWVLPSEGLKVGFRVRDKRNEFFATHEELAEWLLVQDGLGETVYHACATYKVTGSRKAVNALAARSLWLDVDAGEEKDAYADATEAAEAVIQFIRATGLPTPLFVGSGLGLHCYWPLAESLSPEEWKRYAWGLKQACDHNGLHTDRTRTADIASILRSPGTHWRKAGERVVRVGELVGPYDLSVFEHIVVDRAPVGRKQWNGHSLPFSLEPRPAASSQVSFKPASLSAEIVTHEPRYADDIADQCAQVGFVRDNPGKANEPLWHAALGVLAWCEDGEEKAEEWCTDWASWGRDILSKMERSRRLTGATTCAHFASVANPSACATCPLLNRISSPIAIRKQRWDSIPSSLSSSSSLSSPTLPPETVSNGHVSPLANSNIEIPDFAKILPPAPSPFGWSAKFELVFKGEDRNGNGMNVIVSQFPLYLESVQTGEVTSDAFSYRFRQWLPNEGWIDIGLSAETMMGQSGISKLFGRGAAIRDATLFKQYLVMSIDQWNEANRLKMKFDQFGWKQDESGFLYGRNLYTPKSIEPALGSEEVKARSQWLSPKVGGSLSKWSTAASSLFAQGCEPQSFALLSAFAAPLMRFHAVAEGGAVVSLQSEESGSGKTTALTAAASVWGRMDGLSLVNIDTGVAKSLTLSALGNLPVIYDEFSNRDPEVVKDFIIVFTNGRDKMRGTVEGTIRHTSASWQTLLIAACNLPLVDLVNAVGGTDAPGFRILEFRTTLPEGITHKKGDALRKELEANSGYAGDAFLKYLVQPDTLAFVRATLPRFTDQIWERTGLSSEHRFRVRAIASVAVAATIVKHLNILPFSPQRIIDWAVEQAKEKTAVAPVTGRQGQLAISRLSTFLGEHVSNILVLPGPHVANRQQNPLQRPTGKLIARYEKANGRLAIDEAFIQKWATKNNISYQGFVDSLAKQGLLIEKRRMASLAIGTDYPIALTPCIEIDMAQPALSGVVVPIEKLRREA